MKAANAPSAPSYPELSAEPASVFRLQKISEIEAFLRTKVENRERLHKKAELLTPSTVPAACWHNLCRNWVQLALAC